MHSGSDCELDRAEFFRALSPDQLAQMRPRVFEISFQKGRALFFDGEPAKYLWAVRCGEVRQYKSSANGRITTLEVLGPGEVFGAVTAIERSSYSASVEGVTDGIAYCLPRESFLHTVAEDPRIAAEILRIVTMRLAGAHERVRSLAHDSAPSRLAQALLRATHDGVALVTRRALAEQAATTVETAIRVLRGFEQSGAIHGAVGRISILDAPALAKIAEQWREP